MVGGIIGLLCGMTCAGVNADSGGRRTIMTYTKQEMYDCLFKTVYLTMVEQFLPNLKQAPEGMFFAETDLDQLVDLSHQARMIADVGTDIHALGLVDKDKPSRNRRQKRTP
jgi:hypothetical protein